MRRAKIACALIVTSVAGLTSPFAYGQTQASWLQPTDGSWNDPSRWSTDPFFPHNGTPPGTTYDVLVDASGSPYTISSSGSITIDSLRLDAPGTTVQHTGGTFTVAAGSLSIGPQSTFVTDNTGSLSTSGDIVVRGGRLDSLDSRVHLHSGSRFDVTNGGLARLWIGSFTNASMSVTNGGSLDCHGAFLGLGGTATAVGEGPETMLRLNIAQVGDAGIGTMSLRDRVSVEPLSSAGTRVVVGINGGTGELNISGGAQVRAIHFMAGIDQGVPQYTPGTGTILISGADTQVRVPGWMVIGPTSGGAGTLLMDGGTLTVGGFAGPKIINPTGTMLVRGGAFETNGITVKGLLEFTGLGTFSQGTFSGQSVQVDGGQVRFEHGWVVPNSSSLRVMNGGTFQAGTVLGATGTGVIVYDNGGNFQAPRIELTAGGRMVLAPGGEKVLHVNSLLVETASKLDVNDNLAIIDYETISPILDIRQWITTGYNNGSWNGNGILSTSAANNAGFGVGYAEASQIFTSFPAVFGGHEVDDTGVLISYARYGDADLNGQVNLADFNRLAANFGASSGAFWSQGDFTYDGIVNLADFNRLAANFGLSAGPDGVVDPGDWAALASVVPEPAGAAWIAGVATVLHYTRHVRRRR